MSLLRTARNLISFSAKRGKGFNIHFTYRNVLRLSQINSKCALSSSMSSVAVTENHRLRIELAAAYRALHRYGMSEGTDNHLSVLAPAREGGREGKQVLLFAPQGSFWSEVRIPFAQLTCLTGSRSVLFIRQ